MITCFASNNIYYISLMRHISNDIIDNILDHLHPHIPSKQINLKIRKNCFETHFMEIRFWRHSGRENYIPAKYE